MSTSIYQDAFDLVSTAAQQAIISPLGDPYTIGISGLVFDIVGRVSVKASSDITDHYVEANYAIQDHVALKPIIVTMQGRAGEVISVMQPNIIQQVFSALAGLVPLVGLGPTFNEQDSQFYAALDNVTQLGQNVVNTTLSAFQLFNNIATLVTRQQTVFQFLINMRNTRQLCTVETPYAVYQNMIIEDLDAEQGEDTTKISEFNVRFKQILTVDSVIGTSSVSSTATQNTGTTSTIPPAASVGLQPYVNNPVSLGSGFGTSTDLNGVQFTVPNQLQSTYQQQASI